MCKILVVDDHPAFVDVVVRAFDRVGIKAKTAKNGIEAQQLLGEDSEIGAVIIDLHLPGIDGLTLCRRIKKQNPLMLTVAVTGYSNLFTLVEAREAGFDYFLCKPISLSVIQKVGLNLVWTVDEWRKLG